MNAGNKFSQENLKSDTVSLLRLTFKLASEKDNLLKLIKNVTHKHLFYG